MASTVSPLESASTLLNGWSRAARTTAPVELWFYQSVSIADSGAVVRTQALWRRAAAAGYSRVVLADARFARPSMQDAAYLANVARLRALADSLGLQVVPGICTLGREDGALLAEDPDLAEALPVRGAKFVAQGGIARLVADPPVAGRPVAHRRRSARSGRRRRAAEYGYRRDVRPEPAGR